jgi:hypothetical protein
MNSDIAMLQQGFAGVDANREKFRQENKAASPMEQWLGEQIAKGLSPQEVAVGVKAGVIQAPEGFSLDAPLPRMSTPGTAQPGVLSGLRGAPSGGMTASAAPPMPAAPAAPVDSRPVSRHGGGEPMSGPPTGMRGPMPQVRTSRDFDRVVQGAEAMGRLQPRRRSLEEERELIAARNAGRLEQIDRQNTGRVETATIGADARKEVAGITTKGAGDRNAAMIEQRGREEAGRNARHAAYMDLRAQGMNARDAASKVGLDVKDLASARSALAQLYRAKETAMQDDPELEAQIQQMEDVVSGLTGIVHDGRQVEGGRQGAVVPGMAGPNVPRPQQRQAEAALKWARANPQDPRAAAILQKLGVQ